MEEMVAAVQGRTFGQFSRLSFELDNVFFPLKQLLKFEMVPLRVALWHRGDGKKMSLSFNWKFPEAGN